MHNPRLAERYAKSLIDLSSEQKNLDEVYKDIIFLQTVCNTSKEFVAILNSPVIKPDKKSQILKAITENKVNKLTGSFIRLITIKGREINLPGIISSFIEQYNVIKKIRKVKLTTAVEVSDEIKNSFIKDLKTEGIKEIQLQSIIDPAIIGGFILETDGKLADASVAKDLRDIKKQFANNEYIYNLR